MDRLKEYAYHVKPKAQVQNKSTEPSGVRPSGGRIYVDSLFLCYTPDLSPVLNGVTLKIKPAEKAGVVGCTCSGKTTLLMSLFRLLARFW